MFNMRPANSSTNEADSIRMNPARTIKAGEWRASAQASRPSYACAIAVSIRGEHLRRDAEIAGRDQAGGIRLVGDDEADVKSGSDG